jgi:hypothetical protein
MDAEYYHYLTIQNRFNTIVSCLNSLFGIILCLLSYISMDYESINRVFGTAFAPTGFISQFAFACNTEKPNYWDMEDPNNPGFPRMRAETNFTCQVVYVYIYSTFQLIVLSTIPYRYNRFAKTEEQQKLDKQRALKDVEFLQFKLEQRRKSETETEYQTRLRSKSEHKYSKKLTIQDSSFG